MTGEKIICRIKGCHRGIHVETAVKRWGHANVSLICGVHWRLTKAEKAVWHRIRRQARKFGLDSLGDREWRIWDALSRRAAA